jgi:hypothetical protein
LEKNIEMKLCWNDECSLDYFGRVDVEVMEKKQVVIMYLLEWKLDDLDEQDPDERL